MRLSGKRLPGGRRLFEQGVPNLGNCAISIGFMEADERLPIRAAPQYAASITIGMDRRATAAVGPPSDVPWTRR
jgi:hypothetical protein